MNKVVLLPVTNAGRALLRLSLSSPGAWDERHPGCVYGVDFDQVAEDAERDEREFARMDREFEEWCRQTETRV